MSGSEVALAVPPGVVMIRVVEIQHPHSYKGTFVLGGGRLMEITGLHPLHYFGLAANLAGCECWLED